MLNDKQSKMILDWMRKIHQLEYAHRYESIFYSKSEKIIGISAFVITTLVAFSYQLPRVEQICFNRLPFFLKQDYFVPTFSAIASILTGLLTFLKPSEKSEIHKKTGCGYEKLRHRIELILNSKQTDEEEVFKKLDNIREEWESLDAINVSNRHFNKGKNKVKSFNKYPKELSFLEDIIDLKN
jgi:hypothetical protein